MILFQSPAQPARRRGFSEQVEKEEDGGGSAC